MTSKKQKKRGYLLPDEVEGHDLIPVCLCIPDDPFFIAAFRGAVYELTKPWNWEAVNSSEYEKQHAAARLWLTILEENLQMPCNICDMLAACLDNLEPGSTLYDALKNWLANELQNDQDIRDILNQGGSGTVAHPGSDLALISECDDDLLFGFSLQLVQWMNRRIEDVFELLEVATNFIEYLSAVTNLIPYVGAVADYVQAMQDTFQENYLAGYNDTLENKYACDIWCFARKHDCEITWKELTEYFLGKLFIDLGDNDVFDILSVLASGVWNGDEFVHLMMATFCAVLHFGGEWNLWSLGDVGNVVESMKNDPNSDWAVLCDECGWRHHADWNADDEDWEVQDYGRNPAVWTLGQGWYSKIGGSESGSEVALTRTFPARQITRLEVKYSVANVPDYTGGNFNFYAGAVLRENHSFVPQKQTSDPNEAFVEAFDLTYTDPDIDRIEFNVYVNSEVSDNLVHVPEAWIEGMGTDPF